MKKNKLELAITAATLSAFMLTGCGGSSSSDNDDVDAPEVTREHDSRTWQVPPVESLAFDAAAGAPAAARYYGHYDGLQGPSLYAAEFPAEGWNGGVVMYTHGFRSSNELGGQVPNAAWRIAVLQAGYAWAGSSYSANQYDVRAAIEDTNKLASNLLQILSDDWSVQYDAPRQILISGFSLGGHTAAAAVERENMERTRYPVDYEGALPFCQAEQNQFYWLGDYTRAAQELAGFGDIPHEYFQDLYPAIRSALFENDSPLEPWEPKGELGEQLLGIATQLTGGERPIFREFGFKLPIWQNAVFGTGGADGTITGILASNFYDNTDRQYRWTTGDEPTQAELDFNENIQRIAADPNANPLRDDGVRWLPLVQGDFDVPVMTLHTLGDFYVPFVHQQLYRRAAIETMGEERTNELLVQRAIRAPSHCDFSGTEIITAMTEFLLWVNGGDQPAGDEVLDPEVVAAADYGCAFTNNMLSTDREELPACPEIVE